MGPSRRRREKKIQSKDPHSKTKKVRGDGQSSKSDHLTICWHLGKFDWRGPWGDKACDGLDFRKLLHKTISQWERMTWGEIYSASGGRTKGNNSHPVSTSQVSGAAKKRLKQIRLDDIEDLVSLRINSRTRIYGIRDGRSFQFLWYDPWHHMQEKAVFPAQK